MARTMKNPFLIEYPGLHNRSQEFAPYLPGGNVVLVSDEIEGWFKRADSQELAQWDHDGLCYDLTTMFRMARWNGERERSGVPFASDHVLDDCERLAVGLKAGVYLFVGTFPSEPGPHSEANTTGFHQRERVLWGAVGTLPAQPIQGTQTRGGVTEPIYTERPALPFLIFGTGDETEILKEINR